MYKHFLRSMRANRILKNFYIYILSFVLMLSSAYAQSDAKKWADSVYKKLSKDERIAQLMVVRLSTGGGGKKAIYYDAEVGKLITKYNIGGICPFQGEPVKMAEVINKMQSLAKTPLMVCIDGEWGLGMRLDSVAPLPKQMMLGAMSDPNLVYEYGKLVAEQCKRMGIQVNYAPVVDINNNPANPVINDRSFGEDKFKVAEYGVHYMKGMQDNGVMATAKHFPGHGDVSVDSHLDLPVIKKSMDQLDSLELYPFKKIFEAGVGSVMIAHLYIPVIDNRSNRATSISYKNVTELLRKKLGYQGLTFTDALEMQGVKKFFPDGDASVESIIAGNDMLCLPGDVEVSIDKIKKAIKAKRLKWSDIEYHCKRVLEAKYNYGIHKVSPVSTENITSELNNGIPEMRRSVAEKAITLLNGKNSKFFPLRSVVTGSHERIALLQIGNDNEKVFGKKMNAELGADIIKWDYKEHSAQEINDLQARLSGYGLVVISLHNLQRSPASNFGLGKSTIELVNSLQQKGNAITFIFGNPYAAGNFCNAKNLVVAYEDDDIVQAVAFEKLTGIGSFEGKLPVTVCDNFKYGEGLSLAGRTLVQSNAAALGFDTDKLQRIDSIVHDAIDKKSIPGCVVMVLKDGKIAYNKAFGKLAFGAQESVTPESVYDMASVTKICATTISVMKLYDEGKLDLNKNLGDYLPKLKGSDKDSISLMKVLLHEGGLVSFIPFYRQTLDAAGTPLSKWYSNTPKEGYVSVADQLYLKAEYIDTMMNIIRSSKLGAAGKYVYSDNDFIYLGKIVEAISGLSLDEYVRQNFYAPMGLSTIGYLPMNRITKKVIAPTEVEKNFRKQMIHGTVHDPGAAMFGGVAGHAGLFSNAYDIAAVMQMLLQGGSYNGKQFIKPETVKYFTAYHSDISRRGIGFDKPEKDNATQKEPYPDKYASPQTFGHTGFTGTCVWADPAHNLVYVFLSNRVNAADPSLFLKLSVRSKVHDAIYEALGIK